MFCPANVSHNTVPHIVLYNYAIWYKSMLQQLRREFQLVTGITERVSSLVTEWIDTWQHKLLEYMKMEAESSNCLAAKMDKVEGNQYL